MSKDTFKNNPDLQEYYETSDGTQFYKEDLAKNHARSLDDKGVTHVFRDQTIEADRETAKEILAKVPEMDMATAQEYLDAENADTPRKSVVAALEKRIKELGATNPAKSEGTPGAEGTGAGAEGNNPNPEA